VANCGRDGTMVTNESLYDPKQTNKNKYTYYHIIPPYCHDNNNCITQGNY